MERPDIPDHVLQDIAEYYIPSASAKGFLEWTHHNVEPDQVRDALLWFYSVITQKVKEDD